MRLQKKPARQGLAVKVPTGQKVSLSHKTLASGVSHTKPSGQNSSVDEPSGQKYPIGHEFVSLGNGHLSMVVLDEQKKPTGQACRVDVIS